MMTIGTFIQNEERTSKVGREGRMERMELTAGVAAFRGCCGVSRQHPLSFSSASKLSYPKQNLLASQLN